jgi:hypothetical protein
MTKPSIIQRCARAIPGALLGLALVAGLARADATPHTYLISVGPAGEPPQRGHANLTSDYASSSYSGMYTAFSAEATNLDFTVMEPPFGDYETSDCHYTQGGQPRVKPVASWDVFLRVLPDLNDPSSGTTYLVSSRYGEFSSEQQAVAAGMDNVDPMQPLTPRFDSDNCPYPWQSSWGTVSRDGAWVAFQSDGPSHLLTQSALGNSPYSDIFLFKTSEVISAAETGVFTGNPTRDLVSKPAGGAANGPSGNPTFSAAARTFSDPYPPLALYVQPDTVPCVVYQSQASNLDASFTDSNGKSDLFVRCRQSATAGPQNAPSHLLTRTSSGQAINGDAWNPSVSYDGRFVAFVSNATNLAAGVSGTQVYLMDRDPDGDGIYNQENDPIRPMYPTYTLVSRTAAGAAGNAKSWYPSLSANGNFVAFASEASNLETQKTDFDGSTPISDTNGKSDIYLYNQRTRRTELVSVRMSSTSGLVVDLPRLLRYDSFTPSISADGRYVAFKTYDNFVVYSGDDNLDQGAIAPDIFRYDRLETVLDQQIIKISFADSGAQTVYSQTSFPAMSGNKRFVFFTNDDPCFPEGSNVEGHLCQILPYFRNIFARDLGTQPEEAALGAAPGSLTFHDVWPGGSQAATVTLRNWGSELVSLGINNLAISLEDQAKGFSLPPASDHCSLQTLSPTVDGVPAAGSACSFQVVFAPPVGGDPGGRLGAVTVSWSYADPGGPGTIFRTDTIVLDGGTLRSFLPMVRK